MLQLIFLFLVFLFPVVNLIIFTFFYDNEDNSHLQTLQTPHTTHTGKNEKKIPRRLFLANASAHTVEQWVQANPDITIRSYTDHDMRQAVETYASKADWILLFYDSLDTRGRHDLWRTLILQKYGGFAPINLQPEAIPLFEFSDLVVSVSSRNHLPHFVASHKEHPFLQSALDHCEKKITNHKKVQAPGFFLAANIEKINYGRALPEHHSFNWPWQNEDQKKNNQKIIIRDEIGAELFNSVIL